MIYQAYYHDINLKIVNFGDESENPSLGIYFTKNADSLRNLKKNHFLAQNFISCVKCYFHGFNLECFRSTFSHHGGSPLESVGSITGKVVVTATDEVYQDTKHKMKLADEEMKKARYLQTQGSAQIWFEWGGGTRCCSSLETHAHF